MAEDVELSPVQTEKLLQFQDLTGIEDMERCKTILETHHWDIEFAVQDTLNMREGAPSVFRPPSNSPPLVVVSPANQRVFYAVSSWRPTGVWGWGYFIMTLPFHIAYSTFISLSRFLLSFIRPDSRRTITDPLRDVTNFINTFEEKYGSSHPVFYQGTYHQALNDAKRDLKFLLVYLHGDDHQDTDEFCQNIMSNARVISFVDNTFLFWGCSVNSAEGYRVSQALRENTYPFLAVIVLRENKMTVVARFEGPNEPEILIRRLEMIIGENETELNTVRLERHERSVNQTLRLQQDAAYEESLRADQEKEKRRLEEQAQLDRMLMEEREQKIQEERRKEGIRQQKIEYASQMPEEPFPNSPDCINLVIKLPNGKRLSRRFSKDESLKSLYYFVFCHNECPDSFEIVTNFPRKVIPCEPTDQCPEPPTFSEFGLKASEILYVQDLEA